MERNVNLMIILLRFNVLSPNSHKLPSHGKRQPHHHKIAVESKGEVFDINLVKFGLILQKIFCNGLNLQTILCALMFFVIQVIQWVHQGVDCGSS